MFEFLLGQNARIKSFPNSQKYVSSKSSHNGPIDTNSTKLEARFQMETSPIRLWSNSISIQWLPIRAPEIFGESPKIEFQSISVVNMQ